MSKTITSRPLFMWLGLLVIAFPIVLVAALSVPFVGNYITNTLKINNGSFISLAIDYISLAAPVILCVIVYYQSQQINDLEVSRCDIYLGVEGLDYTFDFGNYLAVDKTYSGFNSAHFFSAEKKVLLTNINIGTAKGKPMLLPLVFVTKNQPLIVSLKINSVNVIVKEKNFEIYNGAFTIGGEKINTILKDDSRFLVGFGMIVPFENTIDETHLNFMIEIENQNGHKQEICSKVSLLRTSEESDFVITSSYSSLIK